MKPINLLQSSSPPKRRGRGRSYTRHILAGLAGILLLTGFGASALHLRGLDREVEKRRVSLNEVQAFPPSLVAIQESRDSKQAQLAAARRAQNPLAPDVALALLSQTLPDGITLCELTLTTETSAKPFERSRPENAFGSEAAHPRVSLAISGWAEDELTVAEALERINGIEVLGEARIVASHPDDEGPGQRQVFLIASSVEWRLTQHAMSQVGSQP